VVAADAEPERAAADRLTQPRILLIGIADLGFGSPGLPDSLLGVGHLATTSLTHGCGQAWRKAGRFRGQGRHV
jgi:hypothetical protein